MVHQSIESKAASILAGNLIPQALATLFVTARIISKACIVPSWGADDSMLCAAWIVSLGHTITSCLTTKYGAGVHIENLPIPTLKGNLQVQYATLLLYNLALALTKASICLFYLRIFADTFNRRLALAALAFIACTTIPLELVTLFQCTPVTKVWEKELPGTCIHMFPHFYASATTNMLADVFLLVQVVPAILPLQLPPRQKAALLAVVSLGWLVVVASIVRIARILATIDNDDFTWVSHDTTVWSAVEVDVGLICVAAPATKPLAKLLAPAWLVDAMGCAEWPEVEKPGSDIVRVPPPPGEWVVPPLDLESGKVVVGRERSWSGDTAVGMEEGRGRRGSEVSIGGSTVDLEGEERDLEGIGEEDYGWKGKMGGDFNG